MTLPKPKSNGIIYNRVSTEEQEKNGVSLAYQKDSCLRFARDNDITISEHHIFQESYSGAFFDRPQLAQILSILEKNNFKNNGEKIGCIIVLKRDRLARSVSVYNQILEAFELVGVKIFYAEETLTGEESIDEFMGNTLIGFAQYEKNMIYKRTYSGKRQKSKQGKWSFHIPYGYFKNDDDELEIFEPEAEIIRKIVELYAFEKKTIGAIIGYLNDNKILPPSMSKKATKNQKNAGKKRKNSIMFWSYCSVQRILAGVEKYYIGEYKAFSTKYKMIGKKTIIVGKRDEKDIITIKIPQIISKEIAKMVIERKKLAKKHSKKHSHRTYLLKGKLFCNCQNPELHSFLGYFHNQKQLRNYRCTLCNNRKASPERKCKNTISGLKIEGLVIDTLKDFFLDYNKFLAEYMGEKVDNTEKKVNVIDDLKWKINKLEERRKRAINFALDGMISKQELESIKEEIKSEIEAVNKKIVEEYDVIYNEHKQSLLKGEVSTYIKNIHKYALEYFEKASYEELRAIVDLMIDKVIVPVDRTKPIRIILNIFPGEFDIDKYFYDDRETKVVREYNKQKTPLGKYQVEFSDNIQKETSLKGGDYMFIQSLKKKFHQLFKYGVNGWSGTTDLGVMNPAL